MFFIRVKSIKSIKSIKTSKIKITTIRIKCLRGRKSLCAWQHLRERKSLCAQQHLRRRKSLAWLLCVLFFYVFYAFCAFYAFYAFCAFYAFYAFYCFYACEIIPINFIYYTTNWIFSHYNPFQLSQSFSIIIKSFLIITILFDYH